MNISWIVPGFQSDAADRCIPALTDLAHRVAQHHNLTVFALQYPHRRDDYRVGAIKVHSFGAMGRVSKVERGRSLSAAVRSVVRQPADVLHAFWAAAPAVVGVAAAKVKRRTLIVGCMGGEPVYLPEISYGALGKRLDRLYLSLAMRGANLITAGSQTQADFITARFAKVRPRVMPLGVDLARFTPVFKSLPETPMVLAVGSLLPVKGHIRLLEAIAQVPQIKLKIVGDGPERANLQRRIVELGLGERVELAGSVSADLMPSVYQAADVLVLPSYYESQCVALIEGMACGLPVVAAPVGLAPQLLADTQAGELATDNSPAALAEALHRLLARRDEWPALQNAAVSQAATVSLDVCTQRFLDLYNTIAIR